MKVSSTFSATSGAPTGGAKPAAAGFSLPAAETVAAARAPGGVAAAGPVAGLSALLALQGIGGPEARARALRKGRRLLDALDRLQLAMLAEGPSARHLRLLQGALSEGRDPSGDPALDEALGWTEVRAAVEAAKLERATHG